MDRCIPRDTLKLISPLVDGYVPRDTLKFINVHTKGYLEIYEFRSGRMQGIPKGTLKFYISPHMDECIPLIKEIDDS